MRRFYRGLFIVWVALRYGLDELVLTSFQKPWLRVVARVISIGRDLDAPRSRWPRGASRFRPTETTRATTRSQGLRKLVSTSSSRP